MGEESGSERLNHSLTLTQLNHDRDRFLFSPPQAFVSSPCPSLVNTLSLSPVQDKYIKWNISGKKLQARGTVLDSCSWLSSTFEYCQVSKGTPESQDRVGPWFSLIYKSVSHTTLGEPVVARKSRNDCCSFTEVCSHEFSVENVDLFLEPKPSICILTP